MKNSIKTEVRKDESAAKPKNELKETRRYETPAIQTFTGEQVLEEIGLTFSRALRSFLRQDPDIVLIGEIRDLDTAEISVQASLTGHLVLTPGLHPNHTRPRHPPSRKQPPKRHHPTKLHQHHPAMAHTRQNHQPSDTTPNPPRR